MALHLPLLPNMEFILTDEFEELGMAQTIGGSLLLAGIERLAEAEETWAFQRRLEGINVVLRVAVAGAK